MTTASSCSSSSSNRTSSVQKHYAKYVERGGDGSNVWFDRARDLGYDNELEPMKKLLHVVGQIEQNNSNSELSTKPSLLSNLFQASCGSGCPLRLVPGVPKPGDVVMDLGCGAGHDLVLAQFMVSPSIRGPPPDGQQDQQPPLPAVVGKVIGVDFTPEMIAAAKKNVREVFTSTDDSAPSGTDTSPVEFVTGSIEENDALSCYNNVVDIVISNGVINLCRNKLRVFENAFRLLKPGGRFLFSDVCQVPEESNSSVQIACSIGDVFSS